MRKIEYDIYGIDLRRYTSFLTNEYGERSNLVKILNAAVNDAKQKRYTDRLNAVRRKLVSAGYSEAVDKADAWLDQRVKARGNHKSLTLAEKWKIDDQIARQ